jgi:uncharacterized membrane protein YfcA
MTLDAVASTLLAGYSRSALLFLWLSALVAGLARGFSGFGGALIFIPPASAIVGPMIAAPLLLIIDAVMALGLIPDAWKRADRYEVGIMVLGAVIGIPVGTYILSSVDPLALRWAIAVAVIGLLVLLISGWRYRGKLSPISTVGVGATSGVFSGAAQIGGPPVIVYWLGGVIPGAVVRANLVLYFALSSLITGASYVVTGVITQPALALALTTGPIYGLGLYLGTRLFGIASETTFRRTCYGLITIAAIIGLPALDGFIR